ncbi:GP5 [Branchiostoma lanceolatum]|uniref:GP5 protein n=1 Tax=Branchiostoma lanceolatum TaxID=7740 RepID=A0A8J9ZEP6_BRALA|nr:GP5 [Branchiostoma lanceolatum]
MVAMKLIVLLAVGLSLAVAATAAREACPKPCACFSKDGEKYVNCSRADLTSVPAGIPSEVTATAAREACPKPCACFSKDGTKYVNCSRADLTSVPAGIPSDVQQLLLSGNGIAKLSGADFAGLKSVVSIDLSSNQLTNDAILPGTFDGLPFLGVLNLAANENFTEFPKNLPPQLYTLYFGYNRVTRVTEDSFKHLPQLVYVDFENNQVESVATGSFENQRHLTGLSIGFNQITELPDGVFKTTKLQYLGMRFNQLTRVPTDLPGTLTDLDLVGNKIKEIPSRIFSNLTELLTLQVWQQKTLTTIGDDAFDGLGKLQILDADFCSIDRMTNATLSGLSGMWELYMGSSRIPYIPPGAFHDIKNVTTLWLDGNQLTTLDPVLLDIKTLPRLAEVFIWDNPWTCDCHLRWLKEHIDNNNTAPTVDSPHIMVCNAPPKLKGRAFDTLNPKDFVCEDRDSDPSTAKSSSRRPGIVQVVRDERMRMPFAGPGKSLRVHKVWRDENASICTPAVIDDYSILCMAGVVLLFMWVGFSMGRIVGKGR